MIEQVQREWASGADWGAGDELVVGDVVGLQRGRGTGGKPDACGDDGGSCGVRDGGGVVRHEWGVDCGSCERGQDGRREHDRERSWVRDEKVRGMGFVLRVWDCEVGEEEMGCVLK